MTKDEVPPEEIGPRWKDEAPPKEVGPRWPFRNGTIMRYCFKMAYQGIKTSELRRRIERPCECRVEKGQTQCQKHGTNWLSKLATLRGYRQRKFPTHSWKLDEKNGWLKIYDVKFLGNSQMGKKTKVVSKARKKARKRTGPPNVLTTPAPAGLRKS
jgi:hypothetical protein